MDIINSLITGESINYKTKKLSTREIVSVFTNTHSILKVYGKEGAVKSFEKLEGISVPLTQVIQVQPLILYARKIVSYSQLVVNLMRKGEALCLERSIAVCFALRKMDIDARVVIGRKSAMSASDHFEYHAWIEWNGFVLNDVQAVKTHFIEMQRIPI